MTHNRYGAITDVPGLHVGHAQHSGSGWLSGVTVVLPPAGTLGAVDVRGGGPGTRETDALAPGRLVQTVDAVVLSGGSAYGLAAADGVQRWCADHGLGFEVVPGVRVPIVPAAVVFDLGRGGDVAARPDADLGYAATAATADTAAPTGRIGAGTGTKVGGGVGLTPHGPGPASVEIAGGVGTASLRLAGGVVVGALAVVNAAGSPYDPETGALYAAGLVPDKALRPDVPSAAELAAVGGSAAGEASQDGPMVNTTLAVVATNARLDRPALHHAATAGHDGLARAIRPVHTLLDGDTVFTLATGERAASKAAPPAWQGPPELGGIAAVQAAAADAVGLAVLDAVLASSGIDTPALTVDAYLDHFPSAAPPAAASAT